jgi:phospholipid-binding lipoprotein MlaA
MYAAAAVIISMLVLSLSGCATLPSGKPDPRDRFERFNRSVYKFNTVVDHAVLRPAARGYVRAIPAVVRTSIGNFFTNLKYPNTILNDFLQGKGRDGASDIGRLVVNTVVGIGGLFDPASGLGLERHNEDFGQTLGTWGVHTGPYLMLPFLGPSDMRDAVGLIPDYAVSYEISSHLINNSDVEWGLFVVNVVHTRSLLLDEDKLLDSAFDPYALLRSAWLQRREYLIHGEQSPEDDFPAAGDDSNAPAATPPTLATPAPAAPAAPAPAPPAR